MEAHMRNAFSTRRRKIQLHFLLIDLIIYFSMFPFEGLRFVGRLLWWNSFVCFGGVVAKAQTEAVLEQTPGEPASLSGECHESFESHWRRWHQVGQHRKRWYHQWQSQAYPGTHLVAHRSLSNRKKQIPAQKTDVGVAASCFASVQSIQSYKRLEQRRFIVSFAGLLWTRLVEN